MFFGPSLKFFSTDLLDGLLNALEKGLEDFHSGYEKVKEHDFFYVRTQNDQKKKKILEWGEKCQKWVRL